MGKNISQAVHTTFTEGAKIWVFENVIKLAKSVKQNTSYNSIDMAAKKSNVEESSGRLTIIFYLFLNL